VRALAVLVVFAVVVGIARDDRFGGRGRCRFRTGVLRVIKKKANFVVIQRSHKTSTALFPITSMSGKHKPICFSQRLLAANGLSFVPAR